AWSRTSGQAAAFRVRHGRGRHGVLEPGSGSHKALPITVRVDALLESYRTEGGSNFDAAPYARQPLAVVSEAPPQEPGPRADGAGHPFDPKRHRSQDGVPRHEREQ